MNERHRDPKEHTLEGHSWARGLLEPYGLGNLDRAEERELRETHERLTGLSIAVSSVS
jgi:hypothetical protein